jgi:hypothetical protein
MDEQPEKRLEVTFLSNTERDCDLLQLLLFVELGILHLQQQQLRVGLTEDSICFISTCRMLTCLVFAYLCVRGTSLGLIISDRWSSGDAVPTVHTNQRRLTQYLKLLTLILLSTSIDDLSH